MKYATPESVGISSEKILQYIDILEKSNLNNHDLIIAKGDTIIFEKYWAPFHKDFYHRMYSVSKSFVSLAVGFAEQDGLLNLDDPISKYFPKEMENQTDENMRSQTIRHMLMMSTAKTPTSWFAAKTDERYKDDRVKFYFSNSNPQSRPSGTIFQYDSTGSFVLGALVERLTGKRFMEYLREKMFRKIGVSEDARCMTCPGGHSWGDSAVLCTSLDLLKVARFVLNKGKWNGEQILNEKYCIDASSLQIQNNHKGNITLSRHGYGYLIWRTRNNSFFFFGMGSQFAVCSPDSDMIMVYNGDNQGIEETSNDIIFDNYFDLIESTAQDAPLPENEAAYQALSERTANLKLSVANGQFFSPTAETVSGVCYAMNDNPMGITELQLDFDGSKGILKYTNEQGYKELSFGLGHNEFGDFPEEGYSDEIGSVAVPGHKYHCAASAAWIEESKLRIKVQIIDKYFGILDIIIGFRDDVLGLYMDKTAEDFLWNYVGFAGGKRK